MTDIFVQDPESEILRTRDKGIPQRALQRLRDNRPTRFPTIKRTVSTGDRTGAHPIGPYDDTRTLVFNTSGTTNVSYPLMLERLTVISGTSRYDNSTFDTLTASFHPTSFGSTLYYRLTSGNVVKGVSDVFFDDTEYSGYEVSQQSYTPYKEVKQYEQGNTSSFYLTGTSLTIGEGFTSSLFDKTMIRLEFQNTRKYQFPASTASIAYFNTVTGTFQRVGETEALTLPPDAYQKFFDQGDPVGEIAFNFEFDAKLFGPRGVPVLSGTLFGPIEASTGINCPYSWWGLTNGTSDYSNLITTSSFYQQLPAQNVPGPEAFMNFVESALRSKKFRGVSGVTGTTDLGSNTLFEIEEIQHPFLLEKVAFEVPMQAGDGWLSDLTRITTATGGESSYDIGGPCVTFSLLRQQADDVRELILSATVIPVGDLTQSYHDDRDPWTPEGFLALSSTPSAVITGVDSTFTGSVRFEAVPGVVNGVTLNNVGTAGTTNNPTSVVGVVPIGRSLDNTPSRRSYFGREYSLDSPLDKPLNNGFGDIAQLPGAASGINVRLGLTFEESPYLLLPGDKLIFAVSKHRSPANLPSQGADRRALLNSHDIAIATGTIGITLYGSSIRNQHEYHFSRNQPLNTFNVTETIEHDALSLDEFQVFPTNLYSGTYIDGYISGTISATAGVTDAGYRRVIGLATNNGSNGSGANGLALKKFLNLETKSEQIYDTLLPAPHEIQRQDGAQLVRLFDPGVLYGPTGEIAGLPIELQGRERLQSGSVPTQGLGSELLANSRWGYAFPFEARYAGLTRVQKFDVVVKTSGTFDYTGNALVGANSFNNPPPGGATPGIREAIVNAVFRPGRGHGFYTGDMTGSIHVLVNYDSPTNNPWGQRFDMPYPNQLAKAWYGIGDDLGAHNQPKWTLSETQTPINHNNPVTFFKAVEVRGWKYGVYDARPRYSRAQFRHDKYGQYRDMLEPRKFTRFIDDKGATQSAVTVKFTQLDPSDTDSSNLSTEATSSLPYFDGVARNRSEYTNDFLVDLDLTT